MQWQSIVMEGQYGSSVYALDPIMSLHEHKGSGFFLCLFAPNELSLQVVLQHYLWSTLTDPDRYIEHNGENRGANIQSQRQRQRLGHLKITLAS